MALVYKITSSISISEGSHYTDGKIFEQLKIATRKAMYEIGRIFEENIDGVVYPVMKELMNALKTYLEFVQSAIASRQSVFIFFNRLLRAQNPNSDAPAPNLLGAPTNNTNLGKPFN